MISQSVINDVVEKVYNKANIGTEDLKILVKNFFDIYEEEVHSNIISDPDVEFLLKNYPNTVNRHIIRRCHICRWITKKNDISGIFYDDILTDPIERKLFDIFELFNTLNYYSNFKISIKKLQTTFPQAFKKLNPLGKKIIEQCTIRDRLYKIISSCLGDPKITISELRTFLKDNYEIYI